MRIVGGEHRGRKLIEFKGYDIRPTGDKAKEALFNIINTNIVGSSFLDLFSGTGSMGIEAISRGASNVVFVDKSEESLSIIKKNLSLIKNDSEVIKSEAYDYLLKTKLKFDYIFLDPPYKYEEVDKLLNVIYDRDLIKGRIIYEHRHGENFIKSNYFNKVDSRKYGIEAFEFLEKK